MSSEDLQSTSLFMQPRKSEKILGTVKKRSYKYFDEQKFLAEVKKIRWWNVYKCTDVDQAVFIFTKEVTDILDSMAPVKKFQMRSKYAAWLSEETKVKIKERDRAQELAAETKEVED